MPRQRPASLRRPARRLGAVAVVFVAVITGAMAAEGRSGPTLEDDLAARRQASMIFLSVAAGDRFACALRMDGSPYCWGSDRVVGAEPGSERFTELAASWIDVCGRRADGSVACWGGTGFGEARTGPPAGALTRLDAGAFHTCGLRPDGTPVCWGWNGFGQLDVPTGERFVEVAAGYGVSCGLRADGTVRCWGDDSFGQSTPPSGRRYRTIDASAVTVCGVEATGSTRAGDVSCWGDSAAGQPPTTLRQVAGSTQTVEELSLNGYFGCARLGNGVIRCWGRDLAGETAEQPPGSIAVSAGDNFGCRLTPERRARCWGENRDGQTRPFDLEIGLEGFADELEADLVAADGRIRALEAEVVGAGDRAAALEAEVAQLRAGLDAARSAPVCALRFPAATGSTSLAGRPRTLGGTIDDDQPVEAATVTLAVRHRESGRSLDGDGALVDGDVVLATTLVPLAPGAGAGTWAVAVTPTEPGTYEVTCHAADVDGHPELRPATAVLAVR